jgi:hypothetical protein
LQAFIQIGFHCFHNATIMLSLSIMSSQSASTASDQQLINIIAYLASLVSDPHAIDSQLDILRHVTARRSNDALSAQDRTKLVQLQAYLENYLITSDSLRQFTQESVDRRIKLALGGGHSFVAFRLPLLVIWATVILMSTEYNRWSHCLERRSSRSAVDESPELSDAAAGSIYANLSGLCDCKCLAYPSTHCAQYRNGRSADVVPLCDRKYPLLAWGDVHLYRYPAFLPPGRPIEDTLVVTTSSDGYRPGGPYRS